MVPSDFTHWIRTVHQPVVVWLVDLCYRRTFCSAGFCQDHLWPLCGLLAPRPIISHTPMIPEPPTGPSSNHISRSYDTRTTSMPLVQSYHTHSYDTRTASQPLAFPLAGGWAGVKVEIIQTRKPVRRSGHWPSAAVSMETYGVLVCIYLVNVWCVCVCVCFRSCWRWGCVTL